MQFVPPPALQNVDLLRTFAPNCKNRMTTGRPNDDVTAWHEAGHLAAALYYRHPIDYATNLRHNDMEGGVYYSPVQPINVEESLIVSCCGEHGEYLLTGDEILAARGLGVDQPHIDEYAHRLAEATGTAREAWLSSAGQQATDLIRRRLGEVVKRLAEALMAQRTLTGADARTIFEEFVEGDDGVFSPKSQ